MTIGEEVARARKLSNGALLASLTSILGSSRRLAGLLIAHLGEVEERRLHLLAGFASMFEYCTAKLGMSEDEACRRIEVARLARRFPLLYERLANGSLSLSVAALLKHHLTDANHAELLDAVSGKTVARAREVLAAWFPRPDVAPSIRKLPERRPVSSATEQPSAASSTAPLASSHPAGFGPRPAGLSAVATNAASSTPPLPSSHGFGPHHVGSAVVPNTADGAATSPPAAAMARTVLFDTRPVAKVAVPSEPAAPALPMPPSRGLRPSSNLAPLSPGRFKVSFTADAELKEKLELARDLLRHAVPSGDLATIVGRALDLLIEKTEKRRFARTSQPKRSQPTTRHPTTNSVQTQLTREAGAGAIAAAEANASTIDTGNDASAGEPRCAATDEQNRPAREAEKPRPPAARRPAPPATPVMSSEQSPAHPTSSSTPASAPPSRYLPAAVRRAVHERDGTRCTWQAADGTRCNSRAWLEHDHIIPRGQGGTNDPANIHPYCRAHNRLAAEQTYGQATITRIITRRRATRDNADRAHKPPPP